jgi:hypothetical protein
MRWVGWEWKGCGVVGGNFIQNSIEIMYYNRNRAHPISEHQIWESCFLYAHPFIFNFYATTIGRTGLLPLQAMQDQTIRLHSARIGLQLLLHRASALAA